MQGALEHLQLSIFRTGQRGQPPPFWIREIDDTPADLPGRRDANQFSGQGLEIAGRGHAKTPVIVDRECDVLIFIARNALPRGSERAAFEPQTGLYVRIEPQAQYAT